MQAGLYIAHHRWLDAEYGPGRLHKVGHTGALGRRLCDGAYATAFAPGWRYAAVLEVDTKEEAAALEAAVLHCCRHYRPWPQELIRLDAGRIAEVAAAAAAAMGLGFVRRDGVDYARPTVLSVGAADSAADSVSDRAAPRLPDSVLDRLTVPEEPDLIDEILSWEWTAPPAEMPMAFLPMASLPIASLPIASLPIAETPIAEPGQDETDLDAPEDVGLADFGEPTLPALPPPEARGYQEEAAEACWRELARSSRAILQLACRCGKTLVAFRVIEKELAAGRHVLFLVPGLALLRQTAGKLSQYGAPPPLLVGSDAAPVLLRGGSAVMSTDAAAVRAFLAEGTRKGTGRLVLSTYQSSPLVPTGGFGLVVFDEAHRVCGGRGARPFNHFALASQQGRRLFLTATPAYDTAGLTMREAAIFGGVAFRYHLRQGIEAGYVNNFRLEVVAGVGADADAAAPSQIEDAMGRVTKLLVFCRDTAHAERLCAATRPRGRAAGFECDVAHSRMRAGAPAEALGRFATPGRRAVLFNCRLFQEGVEIPALDGVFFAAPRHSARDIIQSLCRPLSRAPGKADSVVFLPVLHDPGRSFDDPANLERYATIVPYVDALLAEDPRLYEHLLDPERVPYPLGALARGRPAPLLLAAVRRAARQGRAEGGRAAQPSRLLRAEAIPWPLAFGELRRVVETCGRYPKTTDLWRVGGEAINLHTVYRHYAARYAAGALEPYQAAALAALPGWEPFGVEGPYPWGLCLGFLRQWLAEHGSQPPMVNIHTGGYVGLEATAMERLSGALTCINQGDGKARRGKGGDSGFTVSPEKQADLDRLCADYGLRWRKARAPTGELVPGEPTFIQEAYARFKAYHREHGSGGEYITIWFPGFPQKHARQENLAVQAARAAPPRRAGRRPAGRQAGRPAGRPARQAGTA